MTICSFSVVRPVATIVLMLILIVFGLIGLRNMPVREYPDIDVPTISISTEYDGASASVVETKITEIIEEVPWRGSRGLIPSNPPARTGGPE